MLKKLIFYREKNKFSKGQSLALGNIASIFHLLHNYPKAIEYYIKQLKIEESRNIPENIGVVYLNMSAVYNSEHDEDMAFKYIFKAIAIAQQYKESDPSLYMLSILNIGDMYEKSDELDSARIYSEKAYQLAIKNKDDLILGTALNNLGNVYLKLQNYNEAAAYYQKSVMYLSKMGDYNTLSEGKIGMAKVLFETHKTDSAILMAKDAYNLSKYYGLPTNTLKASALLSKLYKSKGQTDSAFAYLETNVFLSDSLDSKDRVKQLESITLSEELRQEELSEIAKKEQEERRERLQLLAIGLLIPIFFLISLFLSKRKVSKRVIEYSGIISILLLFEYITLLIHPIISEQSHHSPLIEIVVLVLVASLITPAHHKIEKWLLSKLSSIHQIHLSKLNPKKE